MNEYEIRDLIARARLKAPVIEPYVKYLEDWVAIVNSNSDGWPYWVAGRNAGVKLAELIKDAIVGVHVAPWQWTRAIGLIKSTATRQFKHGNRVPVPVLHAGATVKRAVAPPHPSDEVTRTLAKELHHSEGECEIDDEAVVSRSDDNLEKGAYVQAWVWVPDVVEE